MREHITIFIIALALTLALFHFFPDWARASCGVKPIRPIMPIGCTKQTAVCIDRRWVWVCQ